MLGKTPVTRRVLYLDPAGPPSRPPVWVAAVVWLVGIGLMLLCEDLLDLANLALVLLLTSCVASLWLSPLFSLVTSAAGVLLFNYFFVPPKGSFSVDLHHHALLLLSMLLVSWAVALMMARLRDLLSQEKAHWAQADAVHTLAEQMRSEPTEARLAQTVCAALSTWTGQPCTMALTADTVGASDTQYFGDTPSEQTRAGLKACIENRETMGPTTGRFENLPCLLLPLQGKGRCLGAVHCALKVQGPSGSDGQALQRTAALLKTVSEQCALALERICTERGLQSAREAQAQSQLRNAFLTAIAHDHRTPLASIYSAASSLKEQQALLSVAQQAALVDVILQEADHLNRMTDNTLRLAQLEHAQVHAPLQWDSLHDLLGSAVQRLRQRHPHCPIDLHMPTALPLVSCNPVMLVQWIDNLVDNAVRHGRPPVWVQVTLNDTPDPKVRLEVLDAGAGVPAELLHRGKHSEDSGGFVPFQKGRHGDGDRGVGLGLSVCQAIAKVHNSAFEIVQQTVEGTEGPMHGFRITLAALSESAFEMGATP